MTLRRRLVVGNWKMNGLREPSATLTRGIRDGVAAIASGHGHLPEIVICPPFTQVATVAALLATHGPDRPIAVGAQDCHTEASGAHTGDVAAEMLIDAGASHVILGHSERRCGHGENDALVQAKTKAAIAAGLTPVVCIGETLEEREAGQAAARVNEQIMQSLPDGFSGVIAYEPIWAIGTGKAATLDDVREIEGPIRTALRDRLGPAADAIGLLYGGSVTPKEAPGLFAVRGIDGVLVGGASLSVEKFLAIVAAAAS